MRGRPAQRDRGAVFPLVAITLVALIGFAALAIDLGYQRMVRRDLQAIADVISLDLSRRLDGSTVDELKASPTFQAALDESRARNDFAPAPGRSLTYRLGEVDRTTRVFTELFGSDVPTAVEVTARDDNVQRWFRPGVGSTSRTAVSTLDATVDVKIGSFLAAADPDLDVPVLNRMLPRLLDPDGDGSDDLGLTVVGWQGVADATIPLGPLATQLGAGTPDQLLTSTVNARDFYVATADVLEAQGDTAAATVFDALAAEVDSNVDIALGDLVTFNQGADGTAASAGATVFPALPLIVGTAEIINQDHFVEIPDLDLGIPGVLDANLQATIIERPQVLYGMHEGDAVSTSQVQLHLQPRIDIDTGLVRITGTIDIDVDVADATATVEQIACAAMTSTNVQGVQLGVDTSAINTTVSQALDIQVVGYDLLEVGFAGGTPVASGLADSSEAFVHTADFLPPDGTANTRRVGSPSLGLLVPLTAVTATAVLPLLGRVDVPVIVDINAVLSNLIPAIDDWIVSDFARTLGLSIAGADLGPMHMQCSSPALVG